MRRLPSFLMLVVVAAIMFATLTLSVALLSAFGLLVWLAVMAVLVFPATGPFLHWLNPVGQSRQLNKAWLWSIVALVAWQLAGVAIVFVATLSHLVHVSASSGSWIDDWGWAIPVMAACCCLTWIAAGAAAAFLRSEECRNHSLR